MKSIVISSEAPCTVWQVCMVTEGKHRAAAQDKWIESHNAFLLDERLYADVGKFIMDAVTGTLFYSDGRCLTTHDLNLSLKDKQYDKAEIRNFVRRKY